MGQYHKYPNKSSIESTDSLSGKDKLGSLRHFSYEALVDVIETTIKGRRSVLYSDNNLTSTDKANLSDENNWSNKSYVGPSIENILVGAIYYDNDYVYEFVGSNLPIRYQRV